MTDIYVLHQGCYQLCRSPTITKAEGGLSHKGKIPPSVIFECTKPAMPPRDNVASERYVPNSFTVKLCSLPHVPVHCYYRYVRILHTYVQTASSLPDWNGLKTLMTFRPGCSLWSSPKHQSILAKMSAWFFCPFQGGGGEPFTLHIQQPVEKPSLHYIHMVFFCKELLNYVCS